MSMVVILAEVLLERGAFDETAALVDEGPRSRR
jgi:hypothetical protein